MISQTNPPTTEPATTILPTTEPATTILPTTEPETTTTPAYNISEVCGGSGWRRVAFFNMADPNQDCPGGLNLTNYSIRSCGRAHTERQSCSSVTFPIDGPQYNQVCGRATAYRWGGNYAFAGYHIHRQTTIDGAYVDGLSLTHGLSPRTHIWTFASSWFNGTSGDIRPDLRCPCDLGNTQLAPLHLLEMTIFVRVLQQ